jgi:hypothetical protein
VRRNIDAISLKPRVDDELAFYANITGVVRGKWHRIPEPKPNGNPFLPPTMYEEDERPLGNAFPAPKELGNTTTYRDSIIGHSGKFSLELSELHNNDTIQFVEVLST